MMCGKSLSKAFIGRSSQYKIGCTPGKALTAYIKAGSVEYQVCFLLDTQLHVNQIHKFGFHVVWDDLEQLFNLLVYLLRFLACTRAQDWAQK